MMMDVTSTGDILYGDVRASTGYRHVRTVTSLEITIVQIAHNSLRVLSLGGELWHATQYDSSYRLLTTQNRFVCFDVFCSHGSRVVR